MSAPVQPENPERKEGPVRPFSPSRENPDGQDPQRRAPDRENPGEQPRVRQGGPA